MVFVESINVDLWKGFEDDWQVSVPGYDCSSKSFN